MIRISRKFNKAIKKSLLLSVIVKWRGLILIILFLVSMLFTPVMAQISNLNSLSISQQNGIELVRKAEENYKNFNFQLAIEDLQKAVTIFGEQGDNLNKAMVMSNLALIYQQLGEGKQAKKEIEQSLDILEKLDETKEKQRILAQAFDIEGKIARNLGHLESALKSWEKAIDIYQSLGDKNKIFQNQINQADVLQDLGFYSRSCNLLIDSLNLRDENNKNENDNDSQDKNNNEDDELTDNSNFPKCKVDDERIKSVRNEAVEPKEEEKEEDFFRRQKLTQKALRSLANVLALSSSDEEADTNNYQYAEQLLRASFEISNSWLQSSSNNFPDCQDCLRDDINFEEDNDNENQQFYEKNDINQTNLVDLADSKSIVNSSQASFNFVNVSENKNNLQSSQNNNINLANNKIYVNDYSYKQKIALIENNKTLLSLANLIANFNTQKLQLARQKIKENENNKEVKQQLSKLELCLKAAKTIYEKIEKNNEIISTYSQPTIFEIKVKMSRLSILIRLLEWDEVNKSKKLENWTEAQNLAEEISQSLTNNNLGINRDIIYPKISLAKNLVCLNINADNSNLKAINPNCLNQNESSIQNKSSIAHNIFINKEVKKQVIKLLTNAIKEAKKIEDLRALSNANGTLGRFYEYLEQLDLAQTFTEEAFSYARSIQADDLLYQWNWQLGRILIQKGEMEKNIGKRRKEAITKSGTQRAIAFYKNSVYSLQKIRGDLVSLSRDAQFDFRDQAEPVYRRTVDLLIQSADSFEQKKDDEEEKGNYQKAQENYEEAQERLKEARDVIEQLQLAELENFFREACIKINEESIDEIINRFGKDTAIIYPIILSDRLEVILSLPTEETKKEQESSKKLVSRFSHYSTEIPEKEVETKIEELRKKLRDKRYIRATDEIKNYSQKIYEWLISPLKSKLDENEIKNLVFVLDTTLQNIPMSTLWNGKKYLIEDYTIAIAPGLKLLTPNPVTEIEFNILAAGISTKQQGFDELPNVKKEIRYLEKNFPTTIALLNESFTKDNFKEKLESNPFSVVHIATHGKFSSNYEKTFIIANKVKINARELDQYLSTSELKNQQIELLVLSACQTAEGDKRAALGLAGVAVKAGVSSTIGSLWNIPDQRTVTLMKNFYENLEQKDKDITKAEALRLAQLNFIEEGKSPYYWGAFVLIGNWL